MRPMTTAFLVIALAVTVAESSAQQPARSGFSGRVEAGVLYLNSTSQFFTDEENEQTDDLDGQADASDQVVPIALFDLRYTREGSRTAFYLGTPLESGEAVPLALGVAQPFPDRSEVDASVFTHLFREVWEDPYLVDRDRDESDVLVYGAQIRYGGILGTGAELRYSLARQDVEDDAIGDRFAALARDGWLHDVALAYRIPLGRGAALVPGIGYERGEMDGRAESYDAGGVGLRYQRFDERYLLNLILGAERAEYDAVHPVFHRERRENTYSVVAVLTLLAPFGGDHVFVDLLAGYSLTESNIDFHDASTRFGGLALGYRL